MADSNNNDATRVLGGDDGAPAGTGLAPGTRIGHYVIRRLLGAGGMGEVYLAEQLQPVQREVALKLLPDADASPTARAFFEVERQALAQMQHAAIAQVFDAGRADDGRLWIVMEFVEGEPLTSYCRERSLDTRQRLQLFQRLCHGVQHAHQKGVIHRDLKPDNVLVREVDGVARPTLIDFGIAMGRGNHPGEAERAGTVSYMSPEQMSGKLGNIDTRSDVYSLGVMLFELLAGHDAGELTTRLFRSGEDVRSTLVGMDAGNTDHEAMRDLLLQAARCLPTELRAVLRMALAPQRDDRYESAAALAADLQRYLERRPLLAMPPTRGYGTRKFVARNRLGLGVSLLVVAALVVGLFVAWQGMQRAQVAAVRAERTADFLAEILAGTDPNVAQGLDNTLMRKVLDNAAARAGKELGGQPVVRVSIEQVIADAYAALGLYDQALGHDVAAWQAARDAGLPPGDRARLKVDLLLRKSAVGLSPDEYLKGVPQVQALIGDLPDDNELKLTVQGKLAKLYAGAGELEEALALVRHVLKLEQQQDPVDPGDVFANQVQLARLYSQTGQYAEAESLYRQILAHDKQEFGKRHSYTLTDVADLSVALMRQQRFVEAESLLGPYLAIANDMFEADHPLRMYLYGLMGSAIRQQGRNGEARPYYQEKLQWALQQYGVDDVRALIARANMAFLLRDVGELAKAEAYARTVIEHMDAGMGKSNGARGAFPALLGTILLRQQRYAEAAAALDRAWAIFTRASGYGPEHPEAQEVVADQIRLYRAWGKPDEQALWQARLTGTEGAGG